MVHGELTGVKEAPTNESWFNEVVPIFEPTLTVPRQRQVQSMHRFICYSLCRINRVATVHAS